MGWHLDVTGRHSLPDTLRLGCRKRRPVKLLSGKYWRRNTWPRGQDYENSHRVLFDRLLKMTVAPSKRLSQDIFKERHVHKLYPIKILLPPTVRDFREELSIFTEKVVVVENKKRTTFHEDECQTRGTLLPTNRAGDEIMLKDVYCAERPIEEKRTNTSFSLKRMPSEMRHASSYRYLQMCCSESFSDEKCIPRQCEKADVCNQNESMDTAPQIVDDCKCEGDSANKTQNSTECAGLGTSSFSNESVLLSDSCFAEVLPLHREYTVEGKAGARRV